MKPKTRIMLVEDNPEYRNVIKLALKRDPGMELINVAGTAERALSSIQDSLHDSPDVILLDLNLPGMSGLDALPLIAQCLPHTKIIILTQSESGADVMRAISLGASGYLLKSATVDQIKEGIETVMAGGASLDPGVALYILHKFKDKTDGNETDCGLTEREMEVLTLLGKGLVKKEIADKLGISYHTASTHIRHIYEKLKVPNAPAAINKGHNLGLFTNSKD